MLLVAEKPRRRVCHRGIWWVVEELLQAHSQKHPLEVQQGSLHCSVLNMVLWSQEFWLHQELAGVVLTIERLHLPL